MQKNSDIILLVGDLGYKMWDKIRDDFPERYFNVGAAEQAMLDMAVGIAMEGKTPVVYSITPFALYRGFETLRTYVNHEKIPIKIVGAGRDYDYMHDGVSHWAHDDQEIVGTLKNIEQLRPVSDEDIVALFPYFITNGKPVYVNVTRKV